MVNQPQPMQRPRGRSERIRQHVHQAVIELLWDLPADALTIPLIAERSGVHQATIYRRWGSVPVILQDVVDAGPVRTSPPPDTGSLRGDLDEYATRVANTVSGPLGVLLLRTAVSNMPPSQDRTPSALLQERSQQLQHMLDRAHARGETPPTVDDLLDIVVAPFYFHALFGPPASVEDARRLVDRLLTTTRQPANR
jgi:AcrR family transcriptional regulator